MKWNSIFRNWCSGLLCHIFPWSWKGAGADWADWNVREPEPILEIADNFSCPVSYFMRAMFTLKIKIKRRLFLVSPVRLN